MLGQSIGRGARKHPNRISISTWWIKIGDLTTLATGSLHDPSQERSTLCGACSKERPARGGG